MEDCQRSVCDTSRPPETSEGGPEREGTPDSAGSDLFHDAVVLNTRYLLRISTLNSLHLHNGDLEPLGNITSTSLCLKLMFD